MIARHKGRHRNSSGAPAWPRRCIQSASDHDGGAPSATPTMPNSARHQLPMPNPSRSSAHGRASGTGHRDNSRRWSRPSVVR
jgi:hypothetical protein